MAQCLAVFLDFAYTARRSEHDTVSLSAMGEALTYFHELWVIFVETGVRPDGFGLPRQHSLVHYIRSIQQFGSPNGLCLSITESKHIEAVKEMWRRSNHNEPIDQMLGTLTRLSKLSAAAVEFGCRGMLQNDVLTAIGLALGDETVEDIQASKELVFLEAQDAQDDDGPRSEGYMFLGERQGTVPTPCPLSSTSPLMADMQLIAVLHLPELARELAQPRLYEYICRFLFQELYPNVAMPQNIEDEGMPEPSRRLKLGMHTSASAVFYAPTEISGPGGMHREIIRATPSWYGKFPRYDTVLVIVDPNVWGMMRYRVARIRQFLLFTYLDIQDPCALVEWFITDVNGPDRATGMWVVRPEEVDGQRVTSIVSLSSIERACHLMPVLQHTYIPVDFHFSEILDAFRAYYVNCYIDYHAHETIL